MGHALESINPCDNSKTAAKTPQENAWHHAAQQAYQPKLEANSSAASTSGASAEANPTASAEANPVVNNNNNPTFHVEQSTQLKNIAGGGQGGTAEVVNNPSMEAPVPSSSGQSAAAYGRLKIGSNESEVNVDGGVSGKAIGVNTPFFGVGYSQSEQNNKDAVSGAMKATVGTFVDFAAANRLYGVASDAVGQSAASLTQQGVEQMQKKN